VTEEELVLKLLKNKARTASGRYEATVVPPNWEEIRDAIRAENEAKPQPARKNPEIRIAHRCIADRGQS